MRSKRIIEGQNVVFDANDVLKPKKGKVLLEMRHGPISFTTDDGVRFWKKHPYQWVSKDESKYLLTLKNPEFREAKIDDVEDYYSYD